MNILAGINETAEIEGDTCNLQYCHCDYGVNEYGNHWVRCTGLGWPNAVIAYGEAWGEVSAPVWGRWMQHGHGRVNKSGTSGHEGGWRICEGLTLDGLVIPR